MSNILRITCLTLFLSVTGTYSLSAQDYPEWFNSLKKNFDEGKKYLSQGQNNKALAYFQIASLYGKDPAPVVMAGNACYKMELYASAIDYYKDAIDLSDSQAAHNNLGLLYGVLGYDDLALEVYEDIDGEKYPNKYVAIGAIAKRHGNYTKALENMHIAKEIEKSYVPWYNLGIIHSDLNNMDSALYYFDKAIEISPEDYSGYNGKLSAFVKLNKSPEEYKHLCEKIIELCPKHTEKTSHLKARAEAYRLTKQESKMKADLEKCLQKLNYLIELHPDAYPFIIDRAEVHVPLGNKEQAIADYKRALHFNPDYDRTKKGLKDVLND